MQRKPVNRLGLRGAGEVKEHPWLKMFPWKDLYDKKIDAPFKPKLGDNFDQKYCNAPEKIGLETKEKYDSYLKEENYKNAFRGFTYNNDQITKENEPAKNSSNRKNTRLDSYTHNIKFNDPHTNISNFNFGASVEFTNRMHFNGSTIIGNISKNESMINMNPNRSDIGLQGLENIGKSNTKSVVSNIENKFIKLKKQSNSASTANLLRQYRQSNISQNSTSTSINYLNKRSASIVNFNNNNI